MDRSGKRGPQLFTLEKSRAIPGHVRACPNMGACIIPANAFGPNGFISYVAARRGRAVPGRLTGQHHVTPTACGNIIVFLEVN
jgi:hypothetical protein